MITYHIRWGNALRSPDCLAGLWRSNDRMRRERLICSFTLKTFEKLGYLYDSLNVSFDLNQKFCKEATKSKFPDIVDEGESGMNINNILSDLGFAQYPTEINNRLYVWLCLQFHIILYKDLNFEQSENNYCKKFIALNASFSV